MDTHRLPASTPVRSESIEKVVGFDAVKMHAPFLLRCCALAIDYIVIVVIPTVGMITNKLLAGTSTLGNVISSNTVWFFALLLGFCNLVVLAAVSSQTLGMMLTGMRIVRVDGRDAKVAVIVLRNTLGYLITLLTLGLGFFVAALNRRGRTLHDMIAGTVVVNAVKRRRMQ